MSDWAALRAPVEAALRALRPVVQEAFRALPATPAFKEDGSAITALDYELERRLLDPLLAIDASFGLFSEEAGVVREGTPMWHVDPLDGTANFARRLGIFGTQLALVDGIAPRFAAIYEPLTDDFSWAADGGGAWREGHRLQMIDREPREARVYVDLSRSGIFREDEGLLGRVRMGCYRVRALGSAAINTRDVASGVADAYFGGRAHDSPLHDLAPGALMIREAGGVTSDGNGHDPLEERRVLVAGGPRVHDWLCTLLADSAAG